MNSVYRFFTDEKLLELERLSGQGYSVVDIALYFDIDREELVDAMSSPDSRIDYHYRRGIIAARAKEEMALSSAAEVGDSKSIALLSQIRYRKNFEAARKGIFYDSEITDSVYSKLESYIQSGSTNDLKPGEALYLETLTLMNSMRRKYGRANTLRFFQKPPFEMSYSKAREMYEHSLNLFYSDSTVEKKAMRNLKAQQLEDAADMVLATAKEPKDFEIYERLVTASAKIRQLDKDDPPPVPKNTYDRPFKYYSLDPKMIGISDLDRNVLARQIDGIVGATEAEKRKARQDGMIDEVKFEEILDEHQEETKRQ